VGKGQHEACGRGCTSFALRLLDGCHRAYIASFAGLFAVTFVSAAISPIWLEISIFTRFKRCGNL
jgi:hypothetical protein